MSALDGKITIESGLRPCIVHIPEKRKNYQTKGDNLNVYDKVIEPEHDIKALFHCWSHKSELVGESCLHGGHPSGQISGTFAIVEYEDGTIREVYPSQIRFVDNAMSEYAFPEAKESREKSEDEWKPLKRVGYVCPKCGQGTMKLDEGIVLTSDPPQYRYQCDKCGYVKCSSSWIEASVLDNYG